MARRPLSRSSQPTTCALISQERFTACASAALSRARSRSMLASIQARNSASAIGPYLMTSASPADSSRSGSVSSVSRSQITRTGW